jgi:hypothetical protein
MTITPLSDNLALCRDIDRMIAVSQQAAHRPIFPVKDAASILALRHHLKPEDQHQLLALISQRCIGKHVPLAFNDFERLGMI